MLKGYITELYKAGVLNIRALDTRLRGGNNDAAQVASFLTFVHVHVTTDDVLISWKFPSYETAFLHSESTS